MRVAQRMGLHRDGTSLGIPPFEAEMRRRLWWQILILDHRIAVVSGTSGFPSSYSWTTLFPSNVNDNDLFVGMRDIPVESGRPTDMLFVSLRCEVFEFIRSLQATRGSSMDAKNKAIDAFEKHLESKYLKHCDPSAPLHSISNLMARLEIWKLRSGVFTPQLIPDLRREIPQNDRDIVFSACLRVLEFHNTMLAMTNVQKFVWYSFTNPPFPAYLYLLCGLRTRTHDDLADRGWTQIADHAENRERHGTWDNSRKSNPLRLAIANLTLKAWNARESARSQFLPVLPIPRFISVLRDQLPSKRLQNTFSDRGAGQLEIPGFMNAEGMPDFNWEMDDSSWPEFLLNDHSMAEWLTGDDLMHEDAILSIGKS